MIQNIERDVYNIRNKVEVVAVNVDAVQRDVVQMHQTVKAVRRS